MDKLKKRMKVRYWNDYRLPGGRQIREPVGYSIKEARAAQGKRRSQKKENRIFDMLPESRMTFNELAEWYLDLPTVRKLKSFRNTRNCLKNWCAIYGSHKVSNVKLADVQRFQEKILGCLRILQAQQQVLQEFWSD